MSAVVEEFHCDECGSNSHDTMACKPRPVPAMDFVPTHVLEELRLLRALWDFVWNEMSTTDPEWPNDTGYSHLPHADNNRLDELGSAVEDHYVKRGFPPEVRRG